MKKWFIVIVGLLLLAGCLGEEAKTEDDLVTLQKYNSLENGSTYEEVVELFGSKGEEMNEEDNNVQNVTWDGVAPDSFIALTFRDGKLVSKFQNGLE